MSLTSRTYADILKCGPNSLFLFLLLSHHTGIDYHDIEKALPISSEGTSIKSISDVAKQFGIETEVRRYQIEDIGSLRMPAILQVKGESTFTRYHFDVMYKVDRSNVYMISSTTGSLYPIRLSRLPFFWTGIALTEKQSFAGQVQRYWRLLALAVCLFTAEMLILRHLLSKTALKNVCNLESPA